MKHLQTFRYIEAVMRAGSIRKAADDMNITASALNRRVKRFEEEFGYEIFERMPSGVRLNPAGELLVQHFRSQLSDFKRVQSQVADLSGERRGHVTIACSQALIPYFLPQQIACYRSKHPGVTFGVRVRDRAAAEDELSNFSSDLALVFEPIHLVDFQVLADISQTVHAVMRVDHPLSAESDLRLRDCLEFPYILPESGYGVRAMIDVALMRQGRVARPMVESDSFDFMRHYVLNEGVVGFQLPIGLQPHHGGELVTRPVSHRDLPSGSLLLGQQRGRTLPVASAKFGQSLMQALEAMTDA
ncbi:LysR family transcriptional regulator [Granulosicoccus sp.]|nr:LysR family transcriptional regulator [Granulosicoccus sp.]